MIIRTQPDQEKLDDLPITLSIKMRLREWVAVEMDLARATLTTYPSDALRREINDALRVLRSNLSIYHSDGKNE